MYRLVKRLCVFNYWFTNKNEEKRAIQKRPISTFVKDLRGKKIDNIIVRPKEDSIYYIEKDGNVNVAEYYNTDTLWNMVLNSEIEVNIENDLKNGGMNFGLMDGLGLLFWLFIFIQIVRNLILQNGLSSIRNKKPTVEMFVETRFNQVQGIDEAKEELEEIVDFLKNPDKYTKSGAKVPKGALLIGSPGTGKTLLARAIAGESSVPFIQCSGSSFVEMFVGVGGKRVRDIFEEARKNEPCIIFIDEIDAIGKKRSVGGMPSNDEREQTINQLLTEMDGFDTNMHIVVIAATNRVDILDDALLRPGRFDRKIMVKLPDIVGRQKILEVHSQNKRLSSDVSLMDIAKQTTGFTGADLENMMNECAIRAVKENNEGIITNKVVEESFQRIVVGLKGTQIMIPETKKRIAYHEAGHAIIGALMSDTQTVRKVSIIPRGNTGGTTFFQPVNDDLNMETKTNLLGRIKVALGGHAAEELIYGSDNVSIGATNDFQQVYNIVDNMLTTYGFGKIVGKMNIKKDDLSESIRYEIDIERKSIVEKCYFETLELLRIHMNELNTLTEQLLEDEIVDGTYVYSLFDKNT